jgi:signal transduction histidine kinase
MTIDNPNALWVGLGLGWLTLALGLFLFHQARQWWRRRRYGDPIDHGLLLVEYGRKLTRAKDRQALGQLLIEALPGELGLQRAALLLPDEYQLVSVGEEALHLPINHAAVRWVASGGEAQQANQGQLLKLIQQGRTDLTWTQVWIPLMRGARLRGLWLLGRRKSQVDYSPEDLRCLTSIAREAAAVLEEMTFAEQERQAALEMRALYRQLITARENERGRLSRELHDGVLQDLCTVTRDLKALESQTASPELPCQDLATRSSETVKAVRAICNDLRPPLLQQNLIGALKALVHDLDSRSSAPVHIETQADDLQLEDDMALAVFRIAQEAINNAIRHADASEIAVRLTQYPDRLRLTVTDDGRGFIGSADSARFVAEGHFGLAGMRERAAMVGGKLDVQTNIDYGTVVILELPILDDK